MKKLLPLLLLFAVAACNNNDPKDEPDVPRPDAPKPLSFSVLNTYPHDTSFYTQGLVVYKGQLYEGTGLETRSRLMKIDLPTGKILQKIDLPAKYFGEGVTILNDTIYQLTYLNKVAISYTLKDFKKIAEYPIEHQGWGLTHNGKELIASDGSSNLYFYEPGTFKLLRKLSVTESGNFSFNLNELEYIEGFIYANQYEAPYIFKIDPSSGVIVAKANLDSIWTRLKAIDPHAEVPNGIAYDADARKIYVTGKLWPELYEIKFSN